ncbi:MAG: type I-U CRISPR-associated protein Cas7 [Gemmatimonadetes bacterium]|nr:type I-U CRISPR-associated protein Cas7 [Gemmatimonadota bacterium]MYE93037.1 type I-U CRISPR-associated protein Cas7 [Gemmatimonadota bacterium]MYJ10219.1 type I-U CRISPR-associated protein Cas7 [Gemmatimonadota bacterium]
MSNDETILDEFLRQDRVLITAEMHLAHGSFFQPTGFPDIGACIYTDGTGKRRCLVESEQSMANRLEAVCMKAPGVWREPLAGELPVIRVEDKEGHLLATNLTEPHRIASSYVLEGLFQTGGETDENGQPDNEKTTLKAKVEEHVGIDGKVWPLDERDKLTQLVFALDPAAMLHGFQFMQWEAVGLRAARLLHARLEATLAGGDGEVHYGLVKVDGIEPGASAAAKSNKGQSIAARARYVPESIEATFEIDVLALREKPLLAARNGKAAANTSRNEEARRFLLALALWKIHRFLTNAPSFDARTGDTMGALRLRADCSLAVGRVSWCGSRHGAAFRKAIPLELDHLVTGDENGVSSGLLADPPFFKELLPFGLGLDTTVTYGK